MNVAIQELLESYNETEWNELGSLLLQAGQKQRWVCSMFPNVTCKNANCLIYQK